MNKTTVAQQTKDRGSLPPAQGYLQRKCACGNHTVAGGASAECARNKNGLQRKLTIGPSNDPLEWEADRIADQVLAASTHSAISDTPHIQRYADQAIEEANNASASVDQVLASPGRSLDPALRQDMELRFGHDFSRVRVHSDEAAEQSAREISANAYTVGHNIVFGAGKFAPGTYDGRRLIAHELTHVVQQSGLGRGVNSLARTRLQRKDEDAKKAPEAPAKPASVCPAGFTLKQRATWFICNESLGTRHLGCSFCNEGEQEASCTKILDLLGNNRIIAPKDGKCGDKFQITAPREHAPVIDVVKAEIPGGTPFDIHREVITALGLDVDKGHYDVCLKGPVGNDSRLVISGGSKCQKPKKR